MSIKDERPEDEVTDDRILSSLLSHRLKLSLKVIASAQALAWHDLPPSERKVYMKQAEEALMKEKVS